MRYLPLLAVLVSLCGSSTPVFAQCCPTGCVPSGYGGGCWYIGTTNSCPAAACPPGPPSAKGSGSGGTGQKGQAPQDPSGINRYGYCGHAYSPSQVADFAKQCVSDLSATSQFWGCLFEDDTGRTEDARTGLSCPARKAQLARLPKCRALCSSYAAARRLCDDRNDVWQQFFGPLGGVVYGSANVDLCGRLLSRIEKRVGRSPGVFHP
jgi:hypothetical protein